MTLNPTLDILYIWLNNMSCLETVLQPTKTCTILKGEQNSTSSSNQTEKLAQMDIKETKNPIISFHINQTRKNICINFQQLSWNCNSNSNLRGLSGLMVPQYPPLKLIHKGGYRRIPSIQHEHILSSDNCFDVLQIDHNRFLTAKNRRWIREQRIENPKVPRRQTGPPHNRMFSGLNHLSSAGRVQE